MEIDAGPAQGVEVRKDAGDAVDCFVRTCDLYGVGAEVDCDLETVFEEAEVFVAGSVEGFDTGGDFQGFFAQIRG